jgi:hypothetical protein
MVRRHEAVVTRFAERVERQRRARDAARIGSPDSLDSIDA